LLTNLSRLLCSCLHAFAAAGLPLYVLPFDVLVTSAGTALIQLIPDSTSIHSVKARSAAAAAAAAAEEAAAAASPRTPNRAAAATAAAAAASCDVSLSQHFFAKWRRGSAECLAAQRRFVESLAAYSLVMYLLQVIPTAVLHPCSYHLCILLHLLAMP
jgi:phosphatidylinositol 4-kinase